MPSMFSFRECKNGLWTVKLRGRSGHEGNGTPGREILNPRELKNKSQLNSNCSLFSHRNIWHHAKY